MLSCLDPDRAANYGPAMRFPSPLSRGRLIKRYKRFLADVTLDDGNDVTAHCANPGSMLGLTEPGAEVWLSPATSPTRKLRWSWELIRADDTLVGINTAHPNGIVADAIAAGAIAGLDGYAALRREVKYHDNSRIDILLEDPDRPPCYVEIKNVHLRRRELSGAAEFPDSVTARGAKHLGALADMVAEGCRAVIFYLVQRDDCDHFSIAGDIDPTYQAAFARALDGGVEAMCYACRVSPAAVEIDRPLPLK